MKVFEIIENSTEMHYPNVYDPKNRDYGKRSKLRSEKVTIKSSKTGKVYGTKTIHQNTT